MNPPAINPQPAPQSLQPVRQTEPLAIVSFILSLCGWFGFAFLGWIPAIVCGHIARSRIRTSGNLQGDGFAISGLVISYIGLALCVLGLLLFLVMFIFMAHEHIPTHTQIQFTPHP